MANIFRAKSLISRTGTFSNEATAPNLVYNTGSQNISGIKAFELRPTVNGTGVLLIGEAAALPTTIVYTTGNQIISGNKTFVNNLEIQGTGIFNSIDLSNVASFSFSGVTIDLINSIINSSGQILISGNPVLTGIPDSSWATQFELDSTGLALVNRIDSLSGSLNSSGINLVNTISALSGAAVLLTGNQNISGIKNFYTRPTINNTGVLLIGEAANEYIFTGDLIVSLTNNKTFGRYTNGQIIPASGKSTSQVLQLALVEPIPPTVSLTSPTTIAFNQTAINNNLNASHTINSLNATAYTGYIEFRRGGVGSWTELTGTLSSSFSLIHSLTDTNFNTSPFNYRYIVEDTIGGVNTGLWTITPASYVAPSLSSISIGSSPADLGNVSTTLAATINRNSPFVDLSSYQLQFQSVIGGVTSAWTNIGSSTAISGPSASFSVPHNDVSLINATSIAYRVQVVDTYQTTPLTLGTRSFLYRNYLGYSSNTSLTLTQIEALTSSTLSNSKTRTVSSVTAGVGNYTYYCYRAAGGDLTSIIQDGAAPVLGAFTKLSDIAGTNAYGASVTYRVYRSNATNAFTNNILAFS